jgi:hypothetical protein
MYVNTIFMDIYSVDMQYANDTTVRKTNVKEKRKNKTKQDKTQKPYKILSL